MWPLMAAAQTEALRRELGRCAAVADVNARVACYDGLAREQQGKPLSPQPPRAVLAPEPVVAKRESAGQPQATGPSDAPGDTDVVDKIASFTEIQPNRLQITLGNGQVWQQTVGKAFFIRKEDSVRISPSSWGHSFRLTVDGHPDFIQVRRLR